MRLGTSCQAVPFSFLSVKKKRYKEGHDLVKHLFLNVGFTRADFQLQLHPQGNLRSGSILVSRSTYCGVLASDDIREHVGEVKNEPDRKLSPR